VKRRNNSAAGDPHQLKIDWTNPGTVTTTLVASEPATVAAEPEPPPSRPATAKPSKPALVQRLPWDFRKTFPRPTDEAIKAGIISEDDCNPDSIRSLHEEHARQALAALRALDTVLDARRGGVDPGTGKKPRSHAARERLRKYLDEEPGRLERSFTAMLGVYEDVFGSQAADAFTKATRAWYAGIEVVADAPLPTEESKQQHEPKRKRISSRLPVPRPLPSAVKAGTFGRDEHGPVNPTADEVWEITQQHADKLIDSLASGEQEQFRNGIASYSEDFGPKAASQLEACARREDKKRSR